jgi:hypothetical protein
VSSDEKPVPKVKEGELSAPSLDDLDSNWGGDEEGLDEDATTVARIPQELMALSRRGNELEKPAPAAKKEEAPPEKHDAITARPPPIAAEQSVVVDAPHEKVDKAPEPAPADPAVVAGDEDEDDDEEEDDEDDPDETDAGWDELVAAEEKRAVAADEAAGLDAEARRKAAEERAAARAARKEKGRAKTLAAKEKRKAKADAQRQRQKKPKKRSIPPPRDGTSPAAPGRGPNQGTAARKDSQPPTSRQRVTGRPAPLDAGAASSAPLAKSQRDVLRMVLLVALVVVLGAFVIGLARR